MYTMLLFLNESKDGGGTCFYFSEQSKKLIVDEYGRYTGEEKYRLETIQPKKGRLLLFLHQIVHEGIPVGKKSQKYIIRSDVMFKRMNPILFDKDDMIAFDLYNEAQEKSSENDFDAAMDLFHKAFKLSPKLADIYGM